MTGRTIVLNAKNNQADTVQSFVTAPSDGKGILILGFTAANGSTASVTYKAYLYTDETLVDPIVPQTPVVRDRFDLGPSIVGQIIPAGGSLRMETSTENALLFNVIGEDIL